jgi:AcrR family transcriptional regulator
LYQEKQAETFSKFQMSETTTTQSPPVAGFIEADDTRGRLLLAMAQSITEKGFAQTVVADVVRIAKVSRRTFYEHFDDRENCFLALCDAFTAKASELIGEAADPALPWQEQVLAGVEVHTALLMANPPLTRSFFFEIYSTGERGAAQHRKIHRRFAEQLVAISEQVRKDNPELNPVSFELASMLVAGIGELAMLEMEEGVTDATSRAMNDIAFGVINALLTSPAVQS